MRDFEFRGALLTKIEETSKERGVEPEVLIEAMLCASLGIDFSLTPNVRPQNRINQGNGGFHVATIVTDGYGYFLTEDSEGRETSRVKADPDDESDISCIKPMQEAVRRAIVNYAHDKALNDL